MNPARLVLLVEDDADVCDAVKETLEDEGYDVAVAENGLRAMNILQASGPLPCLVLLDLMMPVMNGEEFLQEMRKEPRLSSVPVVLLTADGSVPHKARVLNVAAGLRKPVELRDLLATVSEHCRPTGES
jgi:two-component system, chemotaxis family, chemotaxis protein CheY